MKIPLYIQAFNSPFLRPSLKWYTGKVALGVPYFLPRRWRKYTKKELLEKAEESFARDINKFTTLDSWISYYKKYNKSVPLKFGFSSCGLGWKTKWRRDDYRFEFNPVLSFVCFGYQIAVTVVTEHSDQYWESFLAYYYETDKTKSRQERIKDCKERFPCTWSHWEEGEKVAV